MKNFLLNPHIRIILTHILVILLLLVNIIFFTENTISLALQVVLIIAVMLHDKDDRLVKQALEESQEILRSESELFDRNIIISEADLDGVITYANDNFCHISGYSREELIGSPHSIVRDPDAPKAFFIDLWKTIQNGETFNGVFKNKKKDGTFYWVDSVISPIKKNGEIIGYKGIRFDVTDKMLNTQIYETELIQKDIMLRDQSTRFEFAINSSRDGFWDYNLATGEFYLSSGWKKRLGFGENEHVTYLDFINLIPEKERVEHHFTMDKIVDNFPDRLDFVHFRIRFPLVTRAGERLIIEDVGDAFYENDTKELQRITGFHRDITEQDRQNKIIESQNRVAAMGDMLANVAHQWRQPIGAINNTLNDLELDIELDDLEQIDAKRFLEVSGKVKEYTKYLSNTIDDFRGLTSVEKIKVNFMVKDVLEEAYTIVEDSYKKNNIEYILDVKGECNCNFSGYKRELLQVVINILNNAKDVLLEREIKNPSVSSSINRDDKFVYILVKDNAGGVPETILEKIFDPYFTTKHESIGTGIGLFMSKKIITEHFNGNLSVHNEKDGAVFTISLPRPKES